jgi:multiple sugar transport system substrate-binding protein
MLINRTISRRRFGQGLLAGSAPLALGRPAFAQAPAKMTVVSHQVHKLVLTEGAAGDVTAPWREEHGTDLEWITLDLNAIHDRLFREASLSDSEVSFGFLVNARATPDALQLFEPLDDFMASAPVEDIEDIAPGMRQLTELDGQTYGLPFRQATAGLHYNEALFEERGLSGPPKSIEEFAEYARQLTFTRDDGTKVNGFAYEAQNYSNVVNMARAWGGAFITPDYKVVTEEPAMIKALTMLRDFYADGVLARNFAATTQEDMISGMQDGRIAMVYFPFGRTTLFNDPEKSRYAGHFKTMLSPVSEEAPEVEGASITEFWLMVIPKNSKNKELAWDFMRTMSTKENSVKTALNGNGPVRSSTFQDPQIKAKLPYAAQEAEAIRHALVPLPPFDGSAQARDIFIEEMQLCVLGRQTPEETGANIAQRVAPLLPKT